MIDAARLRRDLVATVRLLWTDERWLLPGVAVAAVAVGLWIGATGAAISFAMETVGEEIAFQPWTGTAWLLTGVVALLWLVAPVVVLVHLTIGRMTNHNGNLATGYRIRHPTILLLPPLVLLAAGFGAARTMAPVPGWVHGVLVVAAVFALLRVIAYGYRVFSLSYPLLMQSLLFVNGLALGVAVLTRAAVAVGREATLTELATGLAAETGTAGIETYLLGSRTVVGITAPTPIVAAIALPLGTVVGFVAVQWLAGILTRLRKPDVPRSNLRTEQRYPWYVQPGVTQPPRKRTSGDSSSRSATTTGSGASATDGSGGGTSSADAGSSATAAGGTASGSSAADGTDSTGAESAGAAADDAEDEDEPDDVSHTRVYTPPDGEDAFDVPGVDDEGSETATDQSNETEVFGGPAGTAGLVCPGCGDTFDADADISYCPDCGEALEDA